jgi:hypothetical protein
MQVKHRFAAIADNVYVSWTVVIWIDRHTTPGKVENRWHIIKNLISFGYDFIID